jgi:hypothetical protein
MLHYTLPHERSATPDRINHQPSTKLAPQLLPTYPVTPCVAAVQAKRTTAPGQPPPCIRQTKKDTMSRPIVVSSGGPLPAPPTSFRGARAIEKQKAKSKNRCPPSHNFSPILTVSHQFSRILTSVALFLTISRYFSLFLANSRYNIAQRLGVARFWWTLGYAKHERIRETVPPVKSLESQIRESGQ